MTTEIVKRKPGRPRKNPLPEQVTVSEKAVVEPEVFELPQESLTTPAPVKVYIHPHFGEKDEGDGGIRRVVEGQVRHLPNYGIELVKEAAEADVIAFHATCPQSFVKLYPRKAFVAMCHGLYWSEFEWENWALKVNADVIESIRVSDRVIAVSEWVANAIRRHTSRPVDVIFHGLDLDEWTPDKNEGYVLWNKTRPDPICDPEPMNQLAAIMPETPFVSTFGEKASNVLLTGRLEFSRAKELIRRAGVYLCTSRETFGIGTLEAMACGVPVVGFAFGGQVEFVEHGIDGWLATPGDIDGLKQGVEWAFANREAIGAAARRKAENFRWERFAEQYATVFKEAHAAKSAEGPRTSVIVTNYNLHDYLGECLESVLSQTDPDWECIVVDDASPNPKGREIVEELAAKDPRFKLVANDKNVYLAEARNIGIRVARGRYIIPLDADDRLAPATLATLAGTLDTDRSIHVAYGNVRFTEEDGIQLSNYGPQFKPGHSSWPYPFEFEKQIKQYNLLPYCSMFRKEVWRDTGGYRRRCRTAEDADFWVRAASYGFRPKMVTSEDTLIYRNRPSSMSREQGQTEWIRWFSWSKLPSITPAAATTNTQLPVPSLDPILISVVIPVGPGHEKLVTDAIDSVDAQSFRLWECVVVNDTGKPLETELPSWVRVVETSGKTGPARARNEGIRHARGRLFLPLDADDYLEPDALQMMWETSENGKYIVYSDFWQIDNKGEKRQLHECDDYDPELITGRRRLDSHGNEVEGMIHAVTALTPKKAWVQVGGYDENLPAWEDWDFQISMGNIGVCSRRVAMPLFTYRMHKGFRREENYEFFNQSKDGILRKWGSLWEGGKKLMACGSCSRGRTAAPAAPLLSAMSPKQLSKDAVLIRSNSQKTGSMTYLAPSKTRYYFAGGEEKYVHAQDVDMFLGLGFQVVAPPAEPMAVPQMPVLVADGSPN